MSIKINLEIFAKPHYFCNCIVRAESYKKASTFENKGICEILHVVNRASVRLVNNRPLSSSLCLVFKTSFGENLSHENDVLFT